MGKVVPYVFGRDVFAIFGTFKDVRAQNVPTYRFFLNLPRRKVMIYFCQNGKKNGGSPCLFSRS